MAFSYQDYSQPIILQAQRCWWLKEDGKMCLLGMYPSPYTMQYGCADGHITTRDEMVKRKTK